MPVELSIEQQKTKKAIIDRIWEIDGRQCALYTEYEDEKIGRKEYKKKMAILNEEKADADRAFRVFKRQNPEPSDQGGIPKVDRFLDVELEDPKKMKAVKKLLAEMGVA